MLGFFLALGGKTFFFHISLPLVGFTHSPLFSLPLKVSFWGNLLGSPPGPLVAPDTFYGGLSFFFFFGSAPKGLLSVQFFVFFLVLFGGSSSLCPSPCLFFVPFLVSFVNLWGAEPPTCFVSLREIKGPLYLFRLFTREPVKLKLYLFRLSTREPGKLKLSLFHPFTFLFLFSFFYVSYWTSCHFCYSFRS